MHSSTFIPTFILALALQSFAAPTPTSSGETIFIPGFGEGKADVSQAGVASNGVTTFIISPSPTASGAFASISGPVTVLDGPAGSSEAKFKLTDGSDVDSKCTFKDSNAACTAQYVKSGTTSSTAFSTPLPTGFERIGDATGDAGSGTGSGSGSGSKNGATGRESVSMVGAVMAVGMAVGVLL